MPSVVVFDVNETLSDMRPLRGRFADLGAPEHLATLWFTTLLRDGFALAASGSEAPFARLADAALRTVLTGVIPAGDLDAAIAHVMDGFAGLALHPDVPDGVRALRAAGLRLVTLSNGSADVAERLLAGAGLRDEFEAVLSVADAGAWKPAPASYEHAVRTCGTAPGEMLMVAVHPWDLHGAARAGMATGWIDRTGAPWPDVFEPPTWTAADLPGLAAQLAADVA